jgi:AraC-like DNA-binding protein
VAGNAKIMAVHATTPIGGIVRSMSDVDATTIEGILSGMAAIGVDVAAVRARAALPNECPTPGARWPRETIGIAWTQAFAQFPRVTLGAEVGLAVPFGAFGAIDYLIASADTMGGGLHSLAAHYRGRPGEPRLTLHEEAGGLRLEVRLSTIDPWTSEDFTLAVTLKNCRHIAAETVPVIEACTTRPDPGSEALAALLGTPVRYDRPVASLLFAASMRDIPLRTTDPYLHRTLSSLAASLNLGDTQDPLEQAIRGRLRDMLPDGDAEATMIARSLGMSERTLHRRLQEHGTTWRAVIDGFRRDESKRLLREPGRSLAEIALSMGFSEQATWARAFRRWTGRSPARWAREPLD